MKLYELVRSIDSPDYIQATVANILSTQWPEGGAYSKRLDDLKSSIRSYVLLESAEGETSIAVGHAEVKPAVMPSANDTIGCQVNNAIVVSVVIDPQKRGLGLGNILMQKLESICIDLGYSYIYLWTSDAVNFYKKLKYMECELSLVDVPVFKEVDVSKLQNLFMKRLTINNVNENTSTTTSSSLSLPKPPVAWLRKRIAYEFPLAFLPYHRDIEFALHQEIEKNRFTTSDKSSNNTATINNKNNNNSTAATTNAANKKDYKRMDVLYMKDFPLCRQIGPSCGIAALTMVTGYHSYLSARNSKDNANENSANSLSLSHTLSRINSRNKSTPNNTASTSTTTITTHNKTATTAAAATTNSNNIEIASENDFSSPLSVSPQQIPSIPLNTSKILLCTAIEKGYSSDGEMFNINHLARVYLHLIETERSLYWNQKLTTGDALIEKAVNTATTSAPTNTITIAPISATTNTITIATISATTTSTTTSAPVTTTNTTTSANNTADQNHLISGGNTFNAHKCDGCKCDVRVCGATSILNPAFLDLLFDCTTTSTCSASLLADNNNCGNSNDNDGKYNNDNSNCGGGSINSNNNNNNNSNNNSSSNNHFTNTNRATASLFENGKVNHHHHHHLVVLPYDRETNHHTPCLADGHKAHYCVVIGYGKGYKRVDDTYSHHHSNQRLDDLTICATSSSSSSSSLFQYISVSQPISADTHIDIEVSHTDCTENGLGDGNIIAHTTSSSTTPTADNVIGINNNKMNDHSMNDNINIAITTNANNNTTATTAVTNNTTVTNNTNTTTINANNNTSDNDDDIEYYLLCVHGMSLKPVWAPLQDWIRSNAQLHEAKSSGNASHWKIDHDGIMGPQLANKCLLITYSHE